MKRAPVPRPNAPKPGAVKKPAKVPKIELARRAVEHKRNVAQGPEAGAELEAMLETVDAEGHCRVSRSLKTIREQHNTGDPTLERLQKEWEVESKRREAMGQVRLAASKQERAAVLDDPEALRIAEEAQKRVAEAKAALAEFVRQEQQQTDTHQDCSAQCEQDRCDEAQTLRDAASERAGEASVLLEVARAEEVMRGLEAEMANESAATSQCVQQQTDFEGRAETAATKGGAMRKILDKQANYVRCAVLMDSRRAAGSEIVAPQHDSVDACAVRVRDDKGKPTTFKVDLVADTWARVEREVSHCVSRPTGVVLTYSPHRDVFASAVQSVVSLMGAGPLSVTAVEHSASGANDGVFTDLLTGQVSQFVGLSADHSAFSGVTASDGAAAAALQRVPGGQEGYSMCVVSGGDRRVLVFGSPPASVVGQQGPLCLLAKFGAKRKAAQTAAAMAMQTATALRPLAAFVQRSAAVVAVVHAADASVDGLRQLLRLSSINLER